MLDPVLRRLLDPPLSRTAGWLDRRWVSPDRITAVGLVLGVASAVSAGLQAWTVALVLWLLSRAADGLDGPLARRRRALHPTRASSQAGGFFDITADFVCYGAGVVGVALGVGQPLWPFLLVLLAYYVNGTALLAFSSVAERTGHTIDDGRSVSFLGGLAEGTETIVVHSIWLAVPAYAAPVAAVWAGVVALTAGWRIHAGRQALSRPPSDAPSAR